MYNYIHIYIYIHLTIFIYPIFELYFQMVCRNNVSRLGSLEESIAICWNSLLSGNSGPTATPMYQYTILELVCGKIHENYSSHIKM